MTDRQIARETFVPADLVQYLDGTEIIRTAITLGVDGIDIRFGDAVVEKPHLRPATITWWWTR